MFFLKSTHTNSFYSKPSFDYLDTYTQKNNPPNIFLATYSYQQNLEKASKHLGQLILLMLL